MRIAVVYTGAGVIDMISARIKENYPQCEVMNLLDDTLIKECMREGGLKANTLRRLCNVYQYAYEAGANCILNTCSSVGEAVYVGSQLVPIPILRIDDPMAKEAVENYKRIGVIATLATTLDPTCRLVERWAQKMNKSVTVVRGLAEGAYEHAMAGNGEKHDALIAQTAAALSADCDAFLLAQASMVRMEKKLGEISGKKIYSSVCSGIAQIADYL